MVIRVIIAVMSTWVFYSCDRPFSFSPFEATVPDEIRNSNRKNLLRILEAEQAVSDTFKIAVFSDPHYHFNDLADAINKVNKDSTVAFVVVTGDLTENGLLKEFEIFHEMMRKLRKPFLALIGNHDHLSNGHRIYEQLYGPVNYSFVYKDIKFVMWDNVLWESNRTPDWDWFKLQISHSIEDNNSFKRILPFSHIPPTDGQLVDSAAVMHKLFVENRIQLSMHGHKHDYSNEELYGDGVRYVTVGSPDKRYYVNLTITPDTFTAIKEKF